MAISDGARSWAFERTRSLFFRTVLVGFSSFCSEKNRTARDLRYFSQDMGTSQQRMARHDQSRVACVLAGVILGQTVRIFISGLGDPPWRIGPQADFERPGVSPLGSGVTTARSGRVVRWVEPSGRLRSRLESAVVWSCHGAEVGSVARRTEGHLQLRHRSWCSGGGRRRLRDMQP